ncbi:MAG: hypothetical protein RIB03_03030 [Henriciella sp.]|uniref:hypothetical protein n=1 Tax=Henriciella sp. TaxID=1968823 RepID=UPI0032EC4138
MEATSHVKEAVGVFDSEQKLQAAIDRLLSSGFDRADLSLLAGERAIKERLGHAYHDVKELEDDPAAPSVAFVSKESLGDAEGVLIGAPMYIFGVTAAGMAAVAGGPLVITLAAMATGMGAGAAVGATLAGLLERQHANYIDTQLDHGGILLWVRTWKPDEENKAAEILKTEGARDVHIHDLGSKAGAVTTPESILTLAQFSREERISLLRQWEFDTLARLRAEGEGMGDGSGDRLMQIRNALRSLDAPPAS